jgi:hypothetical protein
MICKANLVDRMQILLKIKMQLSNAANVFGDKLRSAIKIFAAKFQWFPCVLYMNIYECVKSLCYNISTISMLFSML